MKLCSQPTLFSGTSGLGVPVTSGGWDKTMSRGREVGGGDLWEPQEIRVEGQGSLEMVFYSRTCVRLVDWVWRNRERGEYIKSVYLLHRPTLIF